MPKKATELGPLAVGRIKEPGFHAVGGVAGLHMQVAPGGARTWILRVLIAGKRRDMGLGGFPDVTLADAREKARRARDLVDQGIDPILQRRQAKSLLAAQRAAAKTFRQCAEEYIKAKSPEWTNAKHAQQWINTLETYAFPTIGALLIADIKTANVRAVLEPIWQNKTETATRLRQRIEAILDAATSEGLRDGPNPARWKGHLENLLADPGKVRKVKHHAALPIDAMPAFYAALREQEGMGAKALELVTLTAARSGSVRLAEWSEFDLDAALWTIPAAHMKADKEHRVPLSDAAVKLLRALPRMDGVDLVFPAPKGVPLSDMTLTAVTRRMGVEAVPHGMRSTFRDFASERTNYPSEVAEMALAHVIESKTEAAYRRGDLFEKRKALMKDWADFCSGVHQSGTVVPIQERKRA